MNPIELSLFVSRMEAVCDEMGAVLRRTAFSPNIKDRLDFSCALFDRQGELCAQAAHIPVHLGSMAYAMADIVRDFDWAEGDVVIMNDPYLGGTHLPDVTIIAPVLHASELQGFAVSRAHHANIGSDSPGSMPVSTRLEEEGIIISPRFLLREGRLQHDCHELLLALQALDDPDSGQPALTGDIAAQLSSVKTGVTRLKALLETGSISDFQQSLAEMNDYGERLSLAALAQIPEGEYRFEDCLDDDGAGTRDIAIRITLHVREGRVLVDFAGTDAQVVGNVNCPLSVTAAAVYYVFRCLMPPRTPACAGIFRPLSLRAEAGSVVNARYPAAVVAGNVETSSRIVDVVLGALAQALPDLIPAASQGTMNNVAMGMEGREIKEDGSTQQRWDYYETLAGGMGAGPRYPGASAMHSHMTNTLNTPVESLEMHYPLQVTRYALRQGSGGQGRHAGGDGVIREYRFLADAQLSLLTERRVRGPWGLAGGEPGQPGRNSLNGQPLPGKVSMAVRAGDVLRIETPGGGGWGGNSEYPLAVLNAIGSCGPSSDIMVKS